MFEPTERQNFLDLLRPPSGYRLEYAVGTTYSLDFIALTAALLAFVDVETELGEGSVKSIDSLHAVTRLADRVSIFVNRGQISGPSKVSRVTVLYDRIVHEVCLPVACFHPKVWVTHYRPRKTPGPVKRPDIVRVICASKNLTTSSCWEAFVACEGVVHKHKVNHSLNSGVCEFITRLAGLNSSPSRAIFRLREAVAQTAFTFPKPLEKEAAFLWQWHRTQSLHRHLPPNGQRALVISPFVRKSFLEDILNRFEKIIVVSTQRELDAIADEDFMRRLCSPKNRVYVVHPFETDDGTAMDLHAKILVLEDAHGPQTLLGSANASPSAWKGQNCEAIIQFAPGVSIDHFSDRFIFGDKTEKVGGNRPLRGWIAEYKRQKFVEDADEKAEQDIVDICDAIARLEMRAKYESATRILKVSLARVSIDLPSAFAGWTAICEIHLALLSQLHSDSVFKSFADLIDGELSFGDVAVADLTEFLVLRVRHRTLGLERRIILKVDADFSQWREQRIAELLKQLLTRDSLKAFLEAILFDAALRPPIVSSELQGAGAGALPFSTLLADLSVEDVLRSCTEDPSRIDEINRVLKAFEETEWIDEEFRQFWFTFVKAVGEVRGISAND